MNTPKEIWMETTTNKLKLQWLADTGSPRSFITKEQATEIMKHNPGVKLQQYSSQTKYKCFNNNNIKIDGEINITLHFGSWTAQNCRILVVGHKTNNLMGRDDLQKLGIALQQKPNKSPGNQINSISTIQTEKNIIKWIYNKYPHLCTRLGKSKNHIAKSIFKQNHNPTQQKGRRVPLHLLEKVERELDKLIHQIIENKHFDTTKKTRVKCDGSAKGLGACKEQKHENEWHTIAFASRFLNKHESRYSTNELELLAVV